jgi:hypothetical protein
VLRRLAALASTVLVVLPATALAVWGGDEDLAHPSVGAMYFDFTGNGIDADDLICSGSYAGESKPQPTVYDVFLTAGIACRPPRRGSSPIRSWSRSIGTRATALPIRSK